MSHAKIGINEKPALKTWIPLSFQHVFAMFGATVVVPLITGLNPATALFTSGLGTLLYILITQGKVPVYLGSSFAYIAPIVLISGSYGVSYAMGAAFCVGIFYLIISAVISRFGKDWLDRLLPPVVIGSVIIVIGLKLAGIVAMNPSMYDSAGAYQISYVLIAAVTLTIAIVASIVLKGFFNVIPILVGIVGGYIFTLIMGFFVPSFQLIDFTAVAEASWFRLPTFSLPKFHIVPIITFIMVAFATIAEHLGDTIVVSKVVGKDFYKDPGIHRTLAGDGAATALASLFGGPPNTTYGENIGVLAITEVHSVWVIGGAGVIAICLSFIEKVGAIIQTIPGPVMGGVMTMLFGIIASAGIRTLVDSGVDYGDKRNLTISSVIMVIGIGGGKILFPVSESLNFELGGVALATFIGILLNLTLPKSLNTSHPDETGEELILDELERQRKEEEK